MKFTTAFAGALLLLGAVAAEAAPPLVNPLVIAFGGSAHLTPIDQSSNPIPIGQCTLQNLPTSLAISSKDATGFVVAAVASGSFVAVRISCTDGTTTVNSSSFTVTVSPAPYAVTAVGSTSP